MVSRIRWISLAIPLLLAPLADAGSALADTASAWAEGERSKVRLIAGGNFNHQGEKIYAAAIEIRLDDGWKTYWRSPGEGLPPSLDWKKSENAADIAILWPAPQRLEEMGGIVSAGYKGGVVLPVRITPKDAEKPVRLRVNMLYGACDEICIPVEAELALDLDMSQEGEARADIEAALQAVPKPQSAQTHCPHRFVSAALSTGSGKPSLMITTDAKGAEDAAFFAEPPEGFFLPTPVLQSSDARNGRQTYRIMMDDAAARDELRGKELRFTTVSQQGSCETTWRME